MHALLSFIAVAGTVVVMEKHGDELELMQAELQMTSAEGELLVMYASPTQGGFEVVLLKGLQDIVQLRELGAQLWAKLDRGFLFFFGQSGY